MSYEYFDSINGEDLQRYRQKISAIGMEECPFRLPASCWKNDPLTWPPMSYPDIYHYLIDSPGVHFTRHTMKNFRSLEAHNYFVSGWVQPIQSHKPQDSSHMILKAEVKPSWRVTEENHTAWVAVREDGSISTAHCTCKAGLGESCSHVAAIMFKVEAGVRLGFTKLACTSEACKWNNYFVKDVETSTIGNIEFYSEAAKKNISKAINPRQVVPEPASSAEKSIFLNKIRETNAKAVCLSTFAGFAEKFYWNGLVSEDVGFPQPLATFFKENQKNEISNFTATDEQIAALEEATMKQSETMLWHEQRAGRITASKAHQVMHTNLENPSKSLIKSISNPTFKQLNVPAILWGKEHEDDALETYKTIITREGNENIIFPSGSIIKGDEIQQLHVDPVVSRAGLRISQEEPWLGVSPDGYISCTCCGQGVIEVKCPYKWVNQSATLEKLLESKDCHLDRTGSLKKSHQYYAQVQLQMYVCKVNYCHFITWSPTHCVIKMVLRNDNFIETMKTKIFAFWNCHILPVLKSDGALILEEDNGNESVYCKCQDDKPDEPMVGCDNANCKFKWFHYSCVGLKTKPRKAEWYCSAKCRKNAQTSKQ